MAYGSSELDVSATTTDQWMEGNGLDLMSSHNSFSAVLLARSEEPMGDWAWRKESGAAGEVFKWSVYGNKNPTVGGVTRANQVSAITPIIPGANGAASVATTVRWAWAHYQGLVSINKEDETKNRGKEGIVKLSEMQVDQCVATFFEEVGNDFWDNAIGAEDKVQSVNHVLSSATATVGGVDRNDSLNAWWRPYIDSTSEVFNTQTFDLVIDGATHDTGKATGITKGSPDAAWMYPDLYAKLRQDLKPSQRVEVSNMLKGGAKYLQYDDVRCFRETRMLSGTVAVINTGTWGFRYDTEVPEPNAPGFMQDPVRPAMKHRGYNWIIGLGCRSSKHNGYMSNKTAS